MDYSNEDLQLIKEYGIKGYSVEKIIELLEITDTELFKREFKTPDSTVFIMYSSGKPQVNSKLEEAEARKAKLQSDILEVQLDNIQRKKKLRLKLFGV